MQIMLRTKKLTFLTASYTQVATIFPFIVISPAYFAGTIQLGGLMQTASALHQRANRAVVFRRCLSTARRVARGDCAARRLQCRGRERAGRGDREAGDRGRAARRQGRHPDRRPCGAPAARRHAGRRRRPRHCGGRARAGHRLIRRGKIDLVPGDRGHLAVRRGHHPRPQRRQGDDAAAAALFSDRHACRRSHLSGGAGTFSTEVLAEVITAVGLPALAGRLDGGGALEPNAVARRAAAPGHCPRHPASAGLSFPRRGHGVARRDRRRPQSTGCWTSGSSTPPSCRSATAPRCPRSTAAGLRWCAMETFTGCARPGSRPPSSGVCQERGRRPAGAAAR